MVQNKKKSVVPNHDSLLNLPQQSKAVKQALGRIIVKNAGVNLRFIKGLLILRIWADLIFPALLQHEPIH